MRGPVKNAASTSARLLGILRFIFVPQQPLLLMVSRCLTIMELPKWEARRWGGPGSPASGRPESLEGLKS